MNKMEIIRGAAEMVIGVSVGAVVGNLIKATTPINTGKVQQVMVGIGGWAIGGVVSDVVAVQAVERLDQAAKWLTQYVNKDGEVIVVHEGNKDEKSDESNDSDNSDN